MSPYKHLYKSDFFLAVWPGSPLCRSWLLQTQLSCWRRGTRLEQMWVLRFPGRSVCSPETGTSMPSSSLPTRPHQIWGPQPLCWEGRVLETGLWSSQVWDVAEFKMEPNNSFLKVSSISFFFKLAPVVVFSWNDFDDFLFYLVYKKENIQTSDFVTLWRFL